MDLDQLVALVAQDRDHILPFVGAGLTLAAGAPAVPKLARDLASRTGVPFDPSHPSLTVVTRDAEDKHGAGVVSQHVAEIFSGLRLRPTPALTALCGTPGRRILTTNYDDAIERAARERGIEPITLLPNDVRIVDDRPAEGQLYVVHLHGIPDEPSSIVLPGATTHGLADDQVFERFVSSVMAPRILLYLGFSLGPGESHLHDIVRWLGARPSHAQRQYLLLDQAQIDRRREQLEEISTYRNVTVVAYEADAEHTAVERVAVTLAPRADEELAWVRPPLLRESGDDDEESLRRRITGFDYEMAGAGEIEDPADVLAEPRSLIVGGPGLGKTTLLKKLPLFDPARPYAIGFLRDFRTADPPERAIARLLRGVPVETLDAGGALLELDGLDEVDEELEDDAVIALTAAMRRWPHHTWVISARPGLPADVLAAADLPRFRLFASRRWARVYLRTRAVPPDRVSRALLDGYGLGDLIAIPAFAKRLADRLLSDDHAEVTPLELLVEQQYEAARIEANRHRHTTASLADWLCSVAVALELRGRASAPTAELATLQGPDELSADTARRRLVEVTLLADVPGSTAFPAKTLQEGLVADATLRSRDLVTTVHEIAVAHVAGADRLRDDMEMTLDLVFEHAEHDVRRHLRKLDPLRWARTVSTRGTEDDAREAFNLLWSWHADCNLAFALGGESGLRSTRQAITEITRRWPQVVENHRDEFERDLHDTAAGKRLRALMVLGGLPYDDHTVDWLIPMLRDGAPRVFELAAVIAGRLYVAEARDDLIGVLDAREERVRISALRALVEIAPVEDLPDIAARVKVHTDLRPVAKRLDERLDLDTGIALVRARSDMNETTAWLVDRLIDTAHPAAWTPARVAALMAACNAIGGTGEPDPKRLASVIHRHPADALAAIRIHPVTSEPYAPRHQLLPLTRLDPSLLAGDEYEDLRRALARAIEEDAEIQARRAAPSRAERRLPELLDAHGLDLDPREVDAALPRQRHLEPHHRDLLLQLIERWWPSDGFQDEPEAATEAVVSIGPAIEAPLTPPRWVGLLDAHLNAPFGLYPLGHESVTWWLRQTHAADVDTAVVERITTADGNALNTLAIVGHAGPDGTVTDGTVARLRELGPDAARWASIVTRLAENGGASAARDLLTDEVAPDTRTQVIGTLARKRDHAAQIELLEHLRSRVEQGERPDRLTFIDLVPSPEILLGLGRLAEATLSGGAEELRGSVLGHLQQWPTDDVLDVLEDLAANHGASDPWIAILRDNAARRFATREVLDRLPQELAEVAAWFEATACPETPG
jgi:hypothetical protein